MVSKLMGSLYLWNIVFVPCFDFFVAVIINFKSKVFFGSVNYALCVLKLRLHTSAATGRLAACNPVS